MAWPGMKSGNVFVNVRLGFLENFARQISMIALGIHA